MLADRLNLAEVAIDLRMARKPTVADTFAMVNEELHATLGKPETKRGIRRYPVPPDPKVWIDRIHACSGCSWS